MRVGGDHVKPFADVDRTTSFDTPSSRRRRVAPDEVDLAGGVDVGRGHAFGPQVGVGLELERRHRHGRSERQPAVGRHERADVVLPALREQRVGDDERPVGADDGEGAGEDRRAGAGGQTDGARPREAAVDRASDAEQLRAEVDVGEIAPALERRARAVVARDPLLVVLLGRVVRRDDRLAPGDSVARA